MKNGITGMVFNIMRFSVKDGPGIRTTVFLKGCPLACEWCHNPEGQSEAPQLFRREARCIRCWACVDACPEGAIREADGGLVRDAAACRLDGRCAAACGADAWEVVGRRETVSGVMEEVLRDRPFYEESGGGVTFSGGEPLLQVDFLEALLRACRREGLHTAVDTCGAVPYDHFRRVRPLVNLFLYDLKLVDEQRHIRTTGVSNRQIQENLVRLAGVRQRVVVRMPVIPGVNDDEENIGESGRFLSSLPGLPEVELLPYHRTGEGKLELLGEGRGAPSEGWHPPEPPSRGRVAEIARALRGFGLEVRFG